jgi:hypothetical protein
VHEDADLLDVEDDVGHILAHPGDGGELVQHAVDVGRGDGGALQRGQQDAAQRIAERHAEAALQRLRHDRADRRRSRPEITSSFIGLISSCQFL